MIRSATCTIVVLLAPLSGAWADNAEKAVLARVRLSTEPAIVKGCAPVGRVSDDSVKDLRRKIVRAGGNTALLTFGVEDLSMIYADVFRCAAPTATPPRVPPPPPGLPPPPPGAPPPPPPPPGSR